MWRIICKVQASEMLKLKLMFQHDDDLAKGQESAGN